MPITFMAQDDSPICRGHDWQIVDEAKLVKLLARLVTGYYLHVESILKDPKAPFPTVPGNSLDVLIEKLGPQKDETNRFHRDGWVFQMISWIAAHMTTTAKVLIAAPQARPADKGFDGLIAELNNSGKELQAIIICEDKATENSRKTIRDKVWPDIREFERGARDAELQNEVTALLKGDITDALKVVEKIHWKEVRRYRVCVTVGSNDTGDGARKQLFKGFDDTAKGDCKRRQGECIAIDDVREWMDKLCAKVVKELKSLSKAKVK